MAKIRPNQIEVCDLQEYASTASGLGFELNVLDVLLGLGLVCKHGGLYCDPVSGKHRQFDIRAAATYGTTRVRIAVECKNVGLNFPALVSCVPRIVHESVLQVLHIPPQEPEEVRSYFIPRPRARSVRVFGQDGLYPEGDAVGREIAQVGRDGQGNLVWSDEALYEKWTQGLSSIRDLLELAYWDGEDFDGDEAADDFDLPRLEPPFFAITIPILVLPNDRLWVVDYGADGKPVSAPRQTGHCSYYVGRQYEISKVPLFNAEISHIEICTVDGLVEFVNDKLRPLAESVVCANSARAEES
jgi:hypothetical protein